MEYKLKVILELALKLNSVPTRTVFFHFSGHVDTVWVRVYEKGWRLNQNEDKMFEFDLTKPCQDDMHTCIGYLKCLLEESEEA